MKLTRHQSENSPRWALDGRWLGPSFHLDDLLALPRAEMSSWLAGQVSGATAGGALLAPLEAFQEVWASGVTYQRSREARREESATGDIYDRVYAAERPELFFKAVGWRVQGAQQPLRCRADSTWNVPEPEMTLLVNRHGEIVGYTAGNDMSSRSIEGANPLYLPQAKVYNGSCALGPAIQLIDGDHLPELPIELLIERSGAPAFSGQTNTARMNRRPKELVQYLFLEMSFPQGVFLMTGTGIVPPEQFSLAPGDRVTVRVGELTLANEIGR